jgi:hypothetical protein
MEVAGTSSSLAVYVDRNKWLPDGCSVPNNRTIHPDRTLEIDGRAFHLATAVCWTGGHYTAWVRNSAGWTEYNDTTRREHRLLTPLLSTCGVLFFYTAADYKARTSDAAAVAVDDLPTAPDGCRGELLQQPPMPRATQPPVPLAQKPVPLQYDAAATQRMPEQSRQQAAPEPPAALPEPSHDACGARAAAAVDEAAAVDPERLLPRDCGQERLREDATRLLDLYVAEGPAACRRFLAGLPAFIHGEEPVSLASCVRRAEAAIHALGSEYVNSEGAMDVGVFLGDSCFYPLAVLTESLSRATKSPATFYLDVTHGLLSSVLRKSIFVRLGQWDCKNRYWLSGTAEPGQGKSPAMKPLVALMTQALDENKLLAAGQKQDAYHFLGSATTATAVHKIAFTNGYLCAHADEARRCLSKAWATGGKVDVHRHFDLAAFLDTAHGDEFSHTTVFDRQKALTPKKAHPKGPAAEAEEAQDKIRIDPTNVHILFLQQQHFFGEYWAQAQQNHRIGFGQRFLFTFGEGRAPGPMEWDRFHQEVAFPLLADLFRVFVQSVGPAASLGADFHLEVSPDQRSCVKELDKLLHMFSRTRSFQDSFRDACPKSMYWLGTSLLLNALLAQLFPCAIAGAQPDQLSREIPDSAFCAAVTFVHRRYLWGQAVLAQSVKDRVWAAVGTQYLPAPY